MPILSLNSWVASLYQAWFSLDPAIVPDKTRLFSARACWSEHELHAYFTLRQAIHFEVNDRLATEVALQYFFKKMARQHTLSHRVLEMLFVILKEISEESVFNREQRALLDAAIHGIKKISSKRIPKSCAR